MSTAIEVEHHLAGYNLRRGDMHDRMLQFGLALFERLYTIKVPLIRYGRRKRRHRRLLPVAPRIMVNVR